MAVHCSAGHVFDSGLDGDVPSDVAAAVERLGENDVIDTRGIEPGTLQRADHRVLRQLERVDVDERAFERPSDRRTCRRNDHRLSHDVAPSCQ